MILRRALTVAVALVLSGVAVPPVSVAEGNGRTLRVGVYENPPLIHSAPDGTGDGLFIELLAHIAEREGWTLRYVPGNWEQALSRLRGGEIEILPAVAYSDERAQTYVFSRETVFSNWGQIYARPAIEAESFLHLDNRRIAAVPDDIHFSSEHGLRRTLERLSVFYELVPVETYPAVMEAVNSGRADAGVVNRLNGRLIGNRYPDAAETPIIFNPIEMRYAVSPTLPDAAALAAAIDTHVARLSADRDSLYHELVDHALTGYHTPFAVPAWIQFAVAGLVVTLVAAAAVIATFRSELNKRTERLREHQEDLRITLASIGDGVITTDTSGLVTGMNHVAETLTGWTTQQAIGAPLDSVFRIKGGAGSSSAGTMLNRVLDGGQVLRSTDGAHLVTGPYGQHLIDNSFAPIRTEDGEVRGVVVAFRDVSESHRKEEALRKSRNQYENLFSSIRDTIILADEHRVIVDANQPALRDMFGYELSDVVGRETSMLYARQSGFETTGAAVFDAHGTRVGKLLEIPSPREEQHEYRHESAEIAERWHRNR